MHDYKKRLIIGKAAAVPKTISELFKDYNGGSFQAEIQELEAIGNELW